MTSPTFPVDSRVTWLTEPELRAIDDLGDLANDLVKIVPHSPAREFDLSELCALVHALQRLVMANAARRAYPDRFNRVPDDVDWASDRHKGRRLATEDNATDDSVPYGKIVHPDTLRRIIDDLTGNRAATTRDVINAVAANQAAEPYPTKCPTCHAVARSAAATERYGMVIICTDTWHGTGDVVLSGGTRITIDRS